MHPGFALFMIAAALLQSARAQPTCTATTLASDLSQRGTDIIQGYLETLFDAMSLTRQSFPMFTLGYNATLTLPQLVLPITTAFGIDVIYIAYPDGSVVAASLSATGTSAVGIYSTTVAGALTRIVCPISMARDSTFGVVDTLNPTCSNATYNATTRSWYARTVALRNPGATNTMVGTCFNYISSSESPVRCPAPSPSMIVLPQSGRN